MSINVVLHYGGQFVKNLILQYEGGEEAVVVGQDLDKWSYFEAVGLVKDLGFKDGSYRLWWKGDKDVVFRRLLCDEDALLIAENAVMFKADAHIYLEYFEQPPSVTQETKENVPANEDVEGEDEESEEGEQAVGEDELKGIHMDDSEE